MDYTLHHGDCLEVLPTLPANSVDAIVTDPPYGLSNGDSAQGISQRIYNALVKIGFPDLYKWNVEQLKGVNFAGVSFGGSALRGIDRAIRKEAGIGVPECSIDFKGNLSIEHEVNNGNKSPSAGVSDGDLPGVSDSLNGQFLGDFILKIGDLATSSSAGQLLDSCLAEAFPGGFAVPIVASLAPSAGGLDSGGVSIIFGNDDIWLGDSALGDSQATPSIMTFSGTINTLMLRFDLSGRPIELHATHRADHLASIGAFGGAELVRAFPAASGLSAMSEPVRVRFVVLAADRAYHAYWFHLWCPFTKISDFIIPSGGFMGKQWDAVLPDPQVWREALRVAKPGAHLLAFGGSRTYHRLAVAIEDAGWEIRDTIMWLYGSGFPKSHDVSKAIDREAGAEREVVGEYVARGYSEVSPTDDGRNQWAAGEVIDKVGYRTAPATPAAEQWQGWGTALKPAHEPIIVARKPLDGTVASNVVKWGTGAINVDGCRVGCGDGESPEHLKRIDGPDSAPRTNGCYAQDEWTKTQLKRNCIAGHDAGRWPANVVHDGSEEVLRLFPNTGKSAGGGGKKTPGKHGIYGTFNGHQYDDDLGYGDTGSAARFFYCAKANKRDRDEGLEGFGVRRTGAMDGNNGRSGPRVAGDGVTPVDPVFGRNHHPTVKPTSLMRWLVCLVTPPGGTVLDPFTGSGSTGKAAMLEGFRFIGIEQDAEYCEIARARIGYAVADRAFGLFDLPEHEDFALAAD